MFQENESNLFFVFLFVACKPNDIDKKELELALDNSDYKFVDSFGLEKIEVKFRPSEIFVEQELNSNRNSSIFDLKSKYEQYYYFNLKITFENGNDNLFNLLNSNNQIDDLIYIIDENGNQVFFSDYSIPPFIGGNQYTSILVAFKKEEIHSANFKLIYRSIVNGYKEFKFLFNKEKLDNVPRLKIT